MENKETKRRSISKARLYKELVSTIAHHDLGVDTTVGKLMDVLKDEIVNEAVGE